MKPEKAAQILTINEGRKAAKRGRELLASAQTPEEQAAARAYKRVTVGTIVIVLAFVLGLMILTPFCLTSLNLEEGPSRVGTVQSDGQIRYTDNVHVFLSQEELEAQDYGLQPGDKVVIYFDPVTDEPTSAYPYALYEHHTNTRLGILLGYVVLMVVAILVYAIVICRYTSFGSAWYLYCKKQRQAEAEEIPLRAKIVIYAIATVIALVVCWPQLESIIENVREDRRIGALSQQIQDAQAAAEQAEDLAENLATVGQNDEIQEAVSDAGSAAENIRDILDAINGG